MIHGHNCTVEYETAPDVKMEADIQSWSPFHIRFKIAHSRLAELDNLMETKIVRDDADAILNVETERERFVCALVGQAAVGVVLQIRRRRRIIDHILTGLFTLSTLLYVMKPIIWGVVVDVFLVCALFTVHNYFGIREHYTQEIINNSFRR